MFAGTNPDGSQRTGSAGVPIAGGTGAYDDPISAAYADGASIIQECMTFFLPYLGRWCKDP